MPLRKYFSVIVVFLMSCIALQAQERRNLSQVSPPATLYSLPYPPGEEFTVGQGYLEFPTHQGLYAIDWIMPEETPILAARDGVVSEIVDQFSKSGLTDEFRNKANYIVLKHDNGTFTLYMHLAHNGINVKVGQRVKEGEQIALSGNTGYSTTPHLHFLAYRLNGARQDSFPVLFKSGSDEPFVIYREAKYLAPGGAPKPDEGPLKGITGTGELSSIRPLLIKLVKQETDAEQAAIKLKEHLLKNRKAYHELYKNTFAKSQSGDKSAMKELQNFLGSMDLQADPEIARLRTDPASESVANEALLVWWGLYSLP
jgi:Peptidase family M23